MDHTPLLSEEIHNRCCRSSETLIILPLKGKTLFENILRRMSYGKSPFSFPNHKVPLLSNFKHSALFIVPLISSMLLLPMLYRQSPACRTNTHAICLLESKAIAVTL